MIILWVILVAIGWLLCGYIGCVGFTLFAACGLGEEIKGTDSNFEIYGSGVLAGPVTLAFLVCAFGVGAIVLTAKVIIMALTAVFPFLKYKPRVRAKRPKRPGFDQRLGRWLFGWADGFVCPLRKR